MTRKSKMPPLTREEFDATVEEAAKSCERTACNLIIGDHNPDDEPWEVKGEDMSMFLLLLRIAHDIRNNNKWKAPSHV